jgi:hypothetical protein
MRKASEIADASPCDACGMVSTEVAAVAKVIANPTCAEVLEALLSDRALSITAIASEIRVPRSTV